MKEDYIYKDWFSLNSLANFCAEYTKDGKLEKTAWGFIKWLDRKCAPKRNQRNPNPMNKEYEGIGEIKNGDLYISKDGVYEREIVAVLPLVVIFRTFDCSDRTKFYGGLNIWMKDAFIEHNCKKITISPEKKTKNS